MSWMRASDPIRFCDRGIRAVLAMEVILLPFAKRYALHTLGMVLLILLWLAKMGLSKQWLWRRTPLDRPILLFVAWGLLSALFSTHPRYSLGAWRTEMVTQFFFFYLVVTHLQDRSTFRAVHRALMLGSACMACAGVYEFFARGGDFRLRSVRIGALSADYNYASTYFILVIPMILHAVITERSARRKGCFGLLLAMNLLALYFTFTRAAWMGLIAGLLVLGLSVGKRLSVPIMILLGLTALWPVVTHTGNTFYRNMGGADDLGRISTWVWGMDQIKQHPLLGIGYGRETMRKAFPERTEEIRRGLWHLHNTFLETTLEMGLPGGLLLLLLWLWLLRLLILGYRQAPVLEDRWLMLTLVMLWVAYFVRNQFDHLYVDAPAVLFWILMGLGVSRVGLISEGARLPV